MTLSTPTLETERLQLRPFTGADADDLFALQSNAHVLRYWDSPPWTDRTSVARFMAGSRQMAEDGSGARVVIERTSDHTFVGWCTFNSWNPDFRSASLGYCLNEAAWGHGYATEAARVLLRWAFDTLDLNRVQSETDTRNEASARVLEKLGFVLEGTLREDCIVSGDVSDSWVYGLLSVTGQAQRTAGCNRDLLGAYSRPIGVDLVDLWSAISGCPQRHITRYDQTMVNPVRELREAASLSQAELARRSGVAQPNVAAYEAGRRRVSAEMLERLRAAARPLPHDALAARRADLVSLAGRFGFDNVRVLGSAARRTDNPGSDLDILVTRSSGTGLLTIATFAAEASKLLGVEVDVVTDGGLRADHEILAAAVAV